MRRIIFQVILFAALTTAAIVRAIPEPAILAILGLGLAFFSRELKRDRRKVRRRADRRSWGIAPITPLVLVRSEPRSTTNLRKTA